jgi:ribonuclease HII
MIVLGIDEAGRGPVIGPLVLCGVRATPKQRARLAALGLRDSKAYGSSAGARQRRARLARKIESLARVEVVQAEAGEVDRWVAGGGLNALERELARRVIEAGPLPQRIVADGAKLFGPLRQRYAMLEARDRADGQEVLVSAASIVAKARRDAALAEIFAPYQDDFGPIRGGGYPNAATAAFLRAFFRRHRRLPAEVRQSWSWAVIRELGASAPHGTTA